MNLIDFYYEKGNLPERYYNQLNGKTAHQNYIRIKNKQSNFFLDVIKNSLRITINKALNELLKEFEKGIR